MADVGRLAGVSATAVSFVVNGRADGAISPDTQRRVLDAVVELGYRPNLAAQSLRTRRTRTIGFVTDEIAVRAPGGATISAVHDVARRHGSLVLIVNATRDPRVLRRAVDDLMDRQVDAIVYAAAGTRRASLPTTANELPAILVNCFAPAGALPSVLPDEYGGGRAAAGLVLAAGHRRLAVITGMAGSWATRERLKGYRAALRGVGVAASEQVVLEGNYRADSGYQLTQRAIAARPRPTAILCGNDLMALGAYLALGEAGLRVPDEVSVVGYDDREDVAADVHPALSTIRLPYYEMGRHAAETLFSNPESALPARTYIPCPAIARDSVAPPPSSP